LSLDEAMNTTQLGPNGGMLYCLESLEENIDWLIDQLYEINPSYVLIDCPGQSELFATHPPIKNRIKKLNSMI
jgi:Zn-dependent protease with chaperone function